jgi:hypothetical protein
MARGKNKAKQTRVARELKYNTKKLDFFALTEELHKKPNEDYDDNNDELYDDEEEYPRG